MMARRVLRNLLGRVQLRILCDMLVANVRPELARSALDVGAAAFLRFLADDVVQRDARRGEFRDRVGVGCALVGGESVRSTLR